jgi:hypothetical protein
LLQMTNYNPRKYYIFYSRTRGTCEVGGGMPECQLKIVGLISRMSLED